MAPKYHRSERICLPGTVEICLAQIPVRIRIPNNYGTPRPGCIQQARVRRNRESNINTIVPALVVGSDFAQSIPLSDEIHSDLLEDLSAIIRRRG